MRGIPLVAFALSAGSLAASGAGPAAAPLFGRAPYDAGGSSPHRLRVSLDFSAARQILDALSLDKRKPDDASALLALPAVRRQIEESGKDDSRWVEDFNAAFAEESRPATFDLRSIRLDRDRWKVSLAALERDADKIARLAERRAAALLPPETPVEVSAEAELTFGLPGLADHLVLRPSGPKSVVLVIDVARALPGPGEGATPEGEDAFGRLLAAETFRAAWEIFRSHAPGWTSPGELGPAEPLARAAVVMAPVWLFSYDPNFFPLSQWLRDPMVRTSDAFNQEAELLLDPKTDLSKRAEIVARLEHRSLQNDIAISAGVFYADGIYQSLGREELLKALASGPAAFLEAYDRAAGKKGALPALSRKLRQRLEARLKAAVR